jgi:L-serine dehydratase
MARDILCGSGASASRPKRVRISFDKDGSYGYVYREQGSDKGFVTGLLDWDLTGDGFHGSLEASELEGCHVEFAVGSFSEANHPNWMKLELEDDEGNASCVTAASVGGGAVIISEIDGFPAELRGDSWATLLRCPQRNAAPEDLLKSLRGSLSVLTSPDKSGVLLIQQSPDKPPDEILRRLAGTLPAQKPRLVRPIFFPVKGEPLWDSALTLERYAEGRNISIAEAALDHECALLGFTRREAMDEMSRRYAIMKNSCERALAGRLALPMLLLEPSAHRMWEAGKSGRLPCGGPHAKAAARAMAIMHANGGMDVVCAAPTGGAAGALPGVIITLEEELGLSPEETLMALFAASAVGVIIDARATFAAEVAGCQVEIGAGGAMASAAAVYAAGGTLRQSLDAAAISFQNTMGLVCDPVQGAVEVPCHSRNASLAASAFVNADIIMGGYDNAIPLDETIDAVYATGRMLPPELRCTSLGGLSLCPSALAMKRRRN